MTRVMGTVAAIAVFLLGCGGQQAASTPLKPDNAEDRVKTATTAFCEMFSKIPEIIRREDKV